MKHTSPTTSTLYLMVAVASLSLCGCGGGTAANAQSVPSSVSSQTPGLAGSPPPAFTSATGTFTVEGNSASVAGVDSAGRGYRDDVAQLIAEKFSFDPVIQKEAAIAAADYQRTIATPLIAGQDTSSMVMEEGHAGGCSSRRAGLDRHQDLYKATRAIYARTFNTDARMATRQAYVNAAKNVINQDFDPKTCVVPKQ
jgi:hypothetical protein